MNMAITKIAALCLSALLFTGNLRRNGRNELYAGCL
jgi:hypothetical protein